MQKPQPWIIIFYESYCFKEPTINGWQNNYYDMQECPTWLNNHWYSHPIYICATFWYFLLRDLQYPWKDIRIWCVSDKGKVILNIRWEHVNKKQAELCFQQLFSVSGFFLPMTPLDNQIFMEKFKKYIFFCQHRKTYKQFLWLTVIHIMKPKMF